MHLEGKVWTHSANLVIYSNLNGHDKKLCTTENTWD